MESLAAVLSRLHLRVFERGWLSSNNVLVQHESHPTVLIDTGYSAHALQTLALVATALGQRPLDAIINTHLHSDHCGGNAALQARYAGVKTWVPVETFSAVQHWVEASLSFRSTSQRCDRFAATHALSPGDELLLAGVAWQVHAARGHDPTALMFFEPISRVLISADALWEDRLAIVFPELEGAEGFASNHETLDAIERLCPAWVIPGHGAPFSSIERSLEASRGRLKRYASEHGLHALHARRALVMFHMLEHQQRNEASLVRWMVEAPILGATEPLSEHAARSTLSGLIASGALRRVTAADGSPALATQQDSPP